MKTSSLQLWSQCDWWLWALAALEDLIKIHSKTRGCSAIKSFDLLLSLYCAVPPPLFVKQSQNLLRCKDLSQEFLFEGQICNLNLINNQNNSPIFDFNSVELKI